MGFSMSHIGLKFKLRQGLDTGRLIPGRRLPLGIRHRALTPRLDRVFLPLGPPCRQLASHALFLGQLAAAQGKGAGA